MRTEKEIIKKQSTLRKTAEEVIARQMYNAGEMIQPLLKEIKILDWVLKR
jgi:hypothetical protein